MSQESCTGRKLFHQQGQTQIKVPTLQIITSDSDMACQVLRQKFGGPNPINVNWSSPDILINL